MSTRFVRYLLTPWHAAAVLLAAVVFLALTPVGQAGDLPGYVDRARLDVLFAQLHVAPDQATAADISEEIWQVWSTPDDPDVAAQMAKLNAAMVSRNFRDALNVANDLVDSAPDYAEGWNKRATLEYLLGAYTESLADIEETLKREPRHFGALSGEALIWLKLDNRDAARAAIEKALELHPFLAERALFPELGPPATRT